MVTFPLKVRPDQKADLETLKGKGYNPAQLTRIGLDRELEGLRERGILPSKEKGPSE